MQEFCHRCHGQLPQVEPGSKQSSDDAMLFCPRCSAPQILLPEHMRSEGDAGTAATTGATPPPRPYPSDPHQPSGPHQIDWRVALSATSLVALVAAVLRVLGLRFDAVSIVLFFWLLCGANLAVGYYARKRPSAWMDARVGMRIGLVTGMLMSGAMAVASGATGVIVRYGMHGMTTFDNEQSEGIKATELRVQAWMERQNIDDQTRKDFAARMNSPLMNSPEMRAGDVLFSAAFSAIVLTMISAAIGALNGMMRGVRLAKQRRRL